MNTQEARARMREIGMDALRSVELCAQGTVLRVEERQQLRQMGVEARSLLADAGYPGEAVWRGIQQASMGMDTLYGEFDRFYWDYIVEDLKAGLQVLDSLLSPGIARDIDFHIIG